MNLSKASVKTSVRSAINFSATLKPINNRCVFVIEVAILAVRKFTENAPEIHGGFHAGSWTRFSLMPGGRTLGHIAAKCTGPVSWPQAGERAYPAKKERRWLMHFICVCNPEIFVEVGLKMDFPYQAAGEAFGAQMLYVPVDKRCDPSTTHTPRSTTHRPTPICPLQHPPSRLHQQMHLLTKLPLRK